MYEISVNVLEEIKKTEWNVHSKFNPNFFYTVTFRIVRVLNDYQVWCTVAPKIHFSAEKFQTYHHAMDYLRGAVKLAMKRYYIYKICDLCNHPAFFEGLQSPDLAVCPKCDVIYFDEEWKGVPSAILGR